MRTPKAATLHLVQADGSLICDIELDAQEWATMKRRARKERMKVRDWILVELERRLSAAL